MVDWVRLTVLAVPLQHIHIVVPHTRLCCLAEQPSNKMDLQPSLSSWALYISMFVYLRTPVSVPSTLATIPVPAAKKNTPRVWCCPQMHHRGELCFINNCCWVFCTPTQQKGNADVHKLHHSDLFIHTGNFEVCTFTRCVKHTGVRILYNSWDDRGKLHPPLNCSNFFFPIWQPKNTSSSLDSALHHSDLQLHTHGGTERMEMQRWSRLCIKTLPLLAGKLIFV